MGERLQKFRKVLFHAHETPDVRAYLDAELNRVAIKTNWVLSGTLTVVAFLQAPIPLLWGATHDVLTWRIYAISPLAVGLAVTWLWDRSEKYVLHIVAVSFVFCFMGTGYSSAILPDNLTQSWFFSLYLLPMFPAFYPFKLVPRIFLTYGLTVMLLFGYWLGNPAILEFPPLKYAILTFNAICVCSIVLGHQLYNYARENIYTKMLVAIERDKSENLLINMLPEAIANRLKEDQSVIADSFAEASILFIDIEGFTDLSDSMQAEELVSVLNGIMSDFDELTQKYDLEKIKTIGDAYMVAGGVPNEDPDHAIKIANLALDMLATISDTDRPGGGKFSARIGINSGRIVAGVIGTKKFIYDLWGDAVNVASRMESHGEPGRIQVTDAFHELVKDRFVTEYRGEIDVKGKGLMKTWWLLGAN